MLLVDPNFRWTDTGKRILLKFNVNPTLTASNLKVDITKTTIKVAVTENNTTKTVLEVSPRTNVVLTLFKGELFAPVQFTKGDNEKSFWCLSKENNVGVVEISLKKVDKEKSWDSITK